MIILLFKKDLVHCFGTFGNLLIDLLNLKISTFKAAEEQNEMINKIGELKDYILLEEKSIEEEKTKHVIKKPRIKTQIKEILASQKTVLRDAIRLYDRRNDMINAFVSKDIWRCRKKCILHA